MQETWVRSLDGEGPLEKETATHSSILPGTFQGRRSLRATVRGVAESDATAQPSSGNTCLRMLRSFQTRSAGLQLRVSLSQRVWAFPHLQQCPSYLEVLPWPSQ